MNKKGFTLVELLAIIVVMGIVAVLVAPNIIKSFKKSKEKSYDILIKNIETAGENYYLECENGDLSDSRKYGNLACSISNNNTSVTLENLLNLGILKSSDNNDKVINPKNSKNISNCSITITKVVGENYKVTFDVNIPEETCFN